MLVSSSCNDCSHRPGHVSSLFSSAVANLSEREMVKQLQTSFATHRVNNVFIEKRLTRRPRKAHKKAQKQHSNAVSSSEGTAGIYLTLNRL